MVFKHNIGSSSGRRGEAVSHPLPVDQVYPRGRIFPFSFYSVHGEKDMRLVASRRVSLAGPVYGERDQQAMQEASKEGLPFIYSVGLPKEEVVDGFLREEAIRGRIGAQVREAAQDDRIAWWYLKPEELRSWRRPEMAYLEVAARTIRETDPRKRPVWMYDPGHRNAAVLAQTARHLDIVGKGMYVNYSGMKDSRVWCRWTIEQQIQAIAEANPGAMPLAVPEMFRSPAEGETALIPIWVRHDVYCALVAGAKGVVVFSFARRDNFAAAREIYLESYLQAAEELCGDKTLGQVFLFGEKRNLLRVAVTAGSPTIVMAFESGGVKETIEYPSVSHLEAAYGNENFLFLVNSAQEAVRVEISGLPDTGVGAADAFGPANPPTLVHGKLLCDLPALGVTGWRFSAK